MSNRSMYRPLAVSAALCVALGVGAPGMARAQVGHPPTSSPYRELTSKYQFSGTVGYSWGGGGKTGVGPGSGPIYGARFDLHLKGPGAVQLGLNLGSLDRVLLDPNKPPEERNLGTVKQSVVMADAGLNLVLTGEKSWYGFAPYIGLSLGLAFGGNVPEDSLSGYDFNTKFMVAPSLGFRWQLLGPLSVHADARDVIWRLSYPDRFFVVPTDATFAPILDPAFNKNTQWTHNFVLLFSLGYAFGS